MLKSLISIAEKETVWRAETVEQFSISSLLFPFVFLQLIFDIKLVVLGCPEQLFLTLLTAAT